MMRPRREPATQPPSPLLPHVPAWLLPLIDHEAARKWLNLLREQRTATVGSTPSEPPQADEDLDELMWLATYVDRIERERTVTFERRWGILYLPLGLVVVAWLLLMAVWETL